jgi:hypothetical protein
MEEIIKKAMQVFEIPPHRTNYLFLLPPLFVAEADGKLSLKEIMSLRLNAERLGLLGAPDQENDDLELFIENKIEQFSKKIGLANLDLLTQAIQARLASYSLEKAQAIRERIYELCMKVADASGPLLGDNISEEERQMLQKIFYKLEN